MHRSHPWFLLVLVLAMAASPLRAAFDKAGVLGIGARPLGMGDSYVAIADDSSAMYWNPAGMVQVPRMDLSGFAGSLLNGKEYNMAIGFVMPFYEQTAIGVSVVSLYHNTGDSSTEAFENNYKLSFATPLNVEKTVSVGVNLKFLQFSSNAQASYQDPQGNTQTINATASAMGMDLGFLYQILLPSYGKKVSFGFYAEDLDTVLTWESGSQERVPLYLDFGAAYWVEENLVFSVGAANLDDPNISGQPLDNPLYDAQGDTINSLEPSEWRPHLGVEGWFFDNHLGLRTGYTSFATTAGRFTAGVSYRASDWGVDYAYIGHAENLGDSHRLSADYQFGPDSRKVRVVTLVQPPVNLKASPSNNSVDLSWTANPDPNVTGYTIYMSKAPGTGYTPIQKRIQENQVVVDGLTNGTRYYFVVSSVNNSWPSVESAYSGEVSCVPAPIIPGTPSMTGAASTSQAKPEGVVTLKGWAPPLGVIAGYNLYMSKSSGSGYVKVNSAPITGLSYPVTGLDVGERYYFILTSLSKDTPPVESRPSPELSRVATQAVALPGPAAVPAPPK